MQIKSIFNEVINYIYECFCTLPDNKTIIDIAHIGNTANTVYKYDGAMLVDIDMMIIIKAFDESAGKKIEVVCDSISKFILKEYPEIELVFCAVSGPYKPATLRITKQKFFIHILIYSYETYSSTSKLFRYACRKYNCLIQPNRLNKLSQPVTMNDLFYDKYGILSLQEIISSEIISYEHKTLPSLQTKIETYSRDNPVFIEFCFYAITTLARNHARVLGYSQADQYPNSCFFAWYNKTIFNSFEMETIINEKNYCRNNGYSNSIENVPPLVIDWMNKLSSSIR